MNELYELPDGWEWTAWKDIVNVKNGKHYKDVLNPNGQYPIYGSGGIMNYADDYLCNEDTVIIGRKGTINSPILVREKFWNIDTAFGLEANKDSLSPFFLYYFSLHFNFLDLNKSTTLPSLAKSNLQKILMPLPPLQEQKRIVAKLDTLFEKIDKAIALHQKNMDEADVFMGSVLNEVFGELEEKYQLENIGNMIEILTDYHSNGAYKTLKANVELLDSEDYALMIRATDLEKEDYTNNVKYITEKAYHFMSKSKVYGGEIILPKIGTIGNVYLMPYLHRPISLAMNTFMIRCSENVDNKYLYSYLKSPKGYASILSRANGAVTKTITKDAVRSIELPISSLNIQQKTVKHLDKVSDKTEKLKQVQKEKMESLKALKASFLDRAFRGEL